MNAFDYFFQTSGNLGKNLILGPSETVSYKDIYQKSLLVARYLHNTFGENNNIIIISPNSSFFLIAYLGIMKSGNVCVPLNPVIEADNLKYISDSIQCRYTFVPGNITGKYALDAQHIIDESAVEKICEQAAQVDSWVLPDHFDERRLNQILFTSGSTGLPKGVQLSHKNLIANTESILKYLQLTENDIIEVVLPFFYCYGLSLLHTHLRVGGSLVLNNSFMFLGSVFNDLKKYRCTGFSGVPTHFQILLRKSKIFKSLDLPDLRYVTQAGGKLHNVFIREFIEAFPRIRFFVMYGQTEATARLSYLPPEMLNEKMGSIGKGIPDVTLDVLNEIDEPVKPDEVGEIVAKGDNIMTGYLNDPAANAQTLRNGWLYTGDMARKDEDGFIYLTARKKEIIKVGGRRVSPKEIEEVIVSVPEVVDCTIEGVYDELLGEAIKATVVLQDSVDKEQGKEIIISVCRKRLAQYKIPQLFHFEEKLTISSTGKKVKGAGKEVKG